MLVVVVIPWYVDRIREKGTSELLLTSPARFCFRLAGSSAILKLEASGSKLHAAWLPRTAACCFLLLEGRSWNCHLQPGQRMPVGPQCDSQAWNPVGVESGFSDHIWVRIQLF